MARGTFVPIRRVHSSAPGGKKYATLSNTRVQKNQTDAPGQFGTALPVERRKRRVEAQEFLEALARRNPRRNPNLGVAEEVEVHGGKVATDVSVAKVEEQGLVKGSGFPARTAFQTLNVVWTSLKNPKLLYIWSKEGLRWATDISMHTASGCQLLVANTRTASQLTVRALLGYSLTRRDRLKIYQARNDLLKSIPLAAVTITPPFVLVLPALLKRYPSLLPSVFHYPTREKEERRRQKKLRLELASVIQDMVYSSFTSTMINELKAKGVVSSESTLSGFLKKEAQEDILSKRYPKELLSLKLFALKSRIGEPIPPNVLTYLSRFRQDLCIEKLKRPELVVLCRYMVLSASGDNDFLKFQINQKLNSLKRDDAEIHWEGIETLTSTELRQACQDRGMASTGLTKDQLQLQLRIWLSLSMNKDVSPLLLLLYSANQLQQRLSNTSQK